MYNSTHIYDIKYRNINGKDGFQLPNMVPSVDKHRKLEWVSEIYQQISELSEVVSYLKIKSIINVKIGTIQWIYSRLSVMFSYS